MTEQEKREKVIKGLECCANGCHGVCPYKYMFEEDVEVCASVIKDALSLLKAQEQEVVNLTTKIVELTTAQEPVKPVFERRFMSDIELYDCGKCGTSLGAKGIAKYCMACGQAVKWE